MRQTAKDIIENAVAWVEVNYLRKDLTPTEDALVRSVNSYLEEENTEILNAKS